MNKINRQLVDENDRLIDENSELKDLLRWQMSRANKYREFIEDMGLTIESVIEPEQTLDFGNTEEVYITREFIESRRFAIGYRGDKDRLLQRIDELLSLK